MVDISPSQLATIERILINLFPIHDRAEIEGNKILRHRRMV